MIAGPKCLPPATAARADRCAGERAQGALRWVAVAILTTTLLGLGILSATPVEPVAETEPAVDPAPASEPEDTPLAVAAGPVTPVPRPTPERAPRRGLGMLVGGGLVLGMVVVPTLLLTVFDAAAAADCAHSENECWGGFILRFSVPVMVAGLAIGAPLIAAGVQRNRAWKEWRSDHGVVLRPRLDPGRHGLTVGFQLRF